jgi:hypothetical protein
LAVAIIRLARSPLEMALSMLMTSLRSASLVIQPTGAAFPLLIRKPVLSRFDALGKPVFLPANVSRPTNNLVVWSIPFISDTSS